MVGWHHRLSEHESEQTQGDSEGLEKPDVLQSKGHKESDTTEQLNNKNWAYRKLSLTTPF